MSDHRAGGLKTTNLIFFHDVQLTDINIYTYRSIR